jgi:hypothetical protein
MRQLTGFHDGVKVFCIGPTVLVRVTTREGGECPMNVSGISKQVLTLDQGAGIQSSSVKGCKNWRCGSEKKALSKEL